MSDKLVDIDEKFATLELINCSDIDAFLKVIMFSDKKESIIIRSELNHFVLKYIDRSPELKQRLIDNEYNCLDHSYMLENYSKIVEIKNKKHSDTIKQNLISMIDGDLFKNLSEFFNGRPAFRYDDQIPAKYGTQLIAILNAIENTAKLYVKELNKDSLIYYDICELIPKEDEKDPPELRIVFACDTAIMGKIFTRITIDKNEMTEEQFENLKSGINYEMVHDADD